ncbi:MAG: 5-oxoprolinase subunit PxpB [Chitinophagaceae bacterium]|nr:MAG: 5-oxoprolinase subunit PxpB [Chitinophagaceae bacterium]
MSQTPLSYRIVQAGDQAVTLDYGNLIDPAINCEVIAWFNAFQQQPLPGVIEMVPAYSSLTFYYDIIKVRQLYSTKTTAAETISIELEKRLQHLPLSADIPRRLMRIPVCYEPPYAMDMKAMIQGTGLTAEAIIQRHTATTYQVYMLGFLPGFAYMGEVNNSIAMPRKSQPVFVPAGSVGIAGKQTGVYSFPSPGGWMIIGRTPLQLFRANTAVPALLHAGDSVQFYSISRDEFDSY